MSLVTSASASSSFPASAKVGVLLVNLGTPSAPTPAAIRHYLAEFLSDPRVVEIPRLIWWPILHGLVLPFRPRDAARRYAAVWTEAGSPLLVWTERQQQGLQAHYDQRGLPVTVKMAMRYGSPSIASALTAFRTERVERILVLPLYPQYSATTTATVFDETAGLMQTVRDQPELRFVRSFPIYAPYLQAMAQRIQGYWQQHGRPERLVLSFHGVPKRTQELGDPYYDECAATAQALKAMLGPDAPEIVMTFQSRFGKAEWLQPYTEPTVIELARHGVKRVDVVCPGFVSDCLETLEEINMEVRAAFMQAGGQTFHYIPALNDEAAWIAALAELSGAHLQGWLPDLAGEPA
ncbi:MAG: ferrochelatase [Pigmentiphaga sp.]|nr:ferrochelatase [Pigmentiphaga sp.]